MKKYVDVLYINLEEKLAYARIPKDCDHYVQYTITSTEGEEKDECMIIPDDGDMVFYPEEGCDMNDIMATDELGGKLKWFSRDFICEHLVQHKKYALALNYFPECIINSEQYQKECQSSC